MSNSVVIYSYCNVIYDNLSTISVFCEFRIYNSDAYFYVSASKAII